MANEEKLMKVVIFVPIFADYGGISSPIPADMAHRTSLDNTAGALAKIAYW